MLRRPPSGFYEENIRKSVFKTYKIIFLSLEGPHNGLELHLEKFQHLLFATPCQQQLVYIIPLNLTIL